jgi:hypothetical protein
MGRITLFAAATGSQVDRESGILRGVSVITEGEAKGHGMIVDSITLEQVKACAETYVDGLRVKMDHCTGIDAMVGVLRDFVIDGIQLRADLHLLKSHEDFEKILEMAENMPGSFGLSISFSGECEEVEIQDMDEEPEPNSGELPSSEGGSVEIVRAARCMEIYSADLVDQPAANPTGLFQSMPENTPEEVPVVAPVEEVLSEEITPIVETVITSSEPAPEVAEEIEPVSEEESLVSKEEFEVKGPEGTQNLPEDVKPEVKDEAPAISEEEAEQVIKTKLSAVVESFDLQKGEIISLRADLDNAHIELSRLGGELEKRDLRIASLEETKRIALRAAGLLPSDVELEISSEATPFNAAEAYSAAVEAGNKQLAAELFKDHKKAIFAARNGK